MSKAKHPDAVFGPDLNEVPEEETAPAIITPVPPRLTDQVAALAASLGVTPSSGPYPYEPDAFISAVRSIHQQLVGVRQQLQAKAHELTERERILAERERAVSFREAKVRGMEQLVTIVPIEVPQRRGWFGRS